MFPSCYIYKELGLSIKREGYYSLADLIYDSGILTHESEIDAVGAFWVICHRTVLPSCHNLYSGVVFRNLGNYTSQGFMITSDRDVIFVSMTKYFTSKKSKVLFITSQDNHTTFISKVVWLNCQIIISRTRRDCSHKKKFLVLDRFVRVLEMQQSHNQHDMTTHNHHLTLKFKVTWPVAEIISWCRNCKGQNSFPHVYFMFVCGRRIRKGIRDMVKPTDDLIVQGHLSLMVNSWFCRNCKYWNGYLGI